MAGRNREQLIELMQNDTYSSKVVIGDIPNDKIESGKGCLGCLALPFMLGYFGAIAATRYVRNNGKQWLRERLPLTAK